MDHESFPDEFSVQQWHFHIVEAKPREFFPTFLVNRKTFLSLNLCRLRCSILGKFLYVHVY